MDLHRFVKEMFFPRWCCGCAKYGELLCENCFSQLEFSGESSSTFEFLDSITALVDFEKVSKSLIYQLKYASVKEIALVCARMMYLYGNFSSSTYITSIPLHRFRQANRGYNQAEEIAREFSRLVGIPYIQTLYRVVHTHNLASIAHPEERKRIIAGQLAINPGLNLRGATILIVDDVWTTGATMNEAARILKSNDAKKVCGATFAHGR